MKKFNVYLKVSIPNKFDADELRTAIQQTFEIDLGGSMDSAIIDLEKETDDDPHYAEHNKKYGPRK
jgi:hypothetical protein